MHNDNVIRKRNLKFVIATIIIGVMLLGTTAITTITTTEGAFAYRNSHATSQVNDCGNGVEGLNVGCLNTDSQIQGDENAVSLSSQQSFPNPSSAPPPPPEETCIVCFSKLGDQETAFEALLSAETQTQVTSIEQLCQQLEDAREFPETIRGVLPFIESLLISSTNGNADLAAEIIDCLERVFEL
jgi:hypothetical protein